MAQVNSGDAWEFAWRRMGAILRDNLLLFVYCSWLVSRSRGGALHRAASVPPASNGLRASQPWVRQFAELCRTSQFNAHGAWHKPGQYIIPCTGGV